MTTTSPLILPELQNPPTTLEGWDAILPAPPAPVASYIPVQRIGNLLYTAGILPMRDGQVAHTGKVGGLELSVEEGVVAAQLSTLNALSVIKSAVGSLSAIEKVVKVTGFVNSGPNFTQQPAVINGCSNLLADILGDAGKHARSAVGVASLPLNAAVEIEFIVAVK